MYYIYSIFTALSRDHLIDRVMCAKSVCQWEYPLTKELFNDADTKCEYIQWYMFDSVKL